jgi:hypothetical protein
MRRRGIYFNIEEVHTKQKDKTERVKGLTQWMAAEAFYINTNQQELCREFDQFGKTSNIHIFDAIAYGPEVWRPGYMPGTRMNIEAHTGSLPEDMDPETGYGTI